MPLLRNWRKKLVTKSDDKKVPALRFKGFTDDWEQRKLGDFGNVAMNKRIFKNQTSDSGEIPFYKIGTFGKKANSFISKKLFEQYKAKYPYPKIGDILISASGSIGRTVVYKGEDAYFQDSNIVWLNHDKQLTNSFLKQFYLIVKWKGLEGSTIKRLYNKDILSTVINVPSVQEQGKIGDIFSMLDNLITLQQRKLEQLTLLKKAMLQRILTTNDYPKIRFRGFTNVWEQRRLEKMAKITTGKLDANAMVKNGKYDFYTSGIKKFKINTAAFEGPAITIAGNGATVGYMHLADGKFNAYQRTYVLNQFTVNRLFLFYSVKKVLPRSIYQSARTGNIPYIVLNMITDLKVNVPKEKEQKKIGELFTEIQAILINQKNRLRCIKDLKQYLLQNIFL